MMLRMPHNTGATSSFQLHLKSGDIHSNPGPKKGNTTKYPCGDCQCNVRNNQDAILCVECQRWFHARCINMSQATFKYYLENFNFPWTCSFCSLPKFNDSFFEQLSNGPGPLRINSQEAYGGDARDLYIGSSDDHAEPSVVDESLREFAMGLRNQLLMILKLRT